ncbi:RagB/SusD family nutrient uptake outer membrane protein [Desertivirga brevis]|uniref:RagB/SusD family nutrient uptake outer membrane protein n=1 Tax=Desertivirga brevis TaxID=2810310 RepID=UPI001A957A4B|nr:RagB/SusD family nutrient uptake outer membrane protein [Pedobacter sp. SYSU D00873]
MIKNISYKILLLLVLLAGTSCKKWLDLEPQDGLIRENFWKTKEQLKSAVIGIYGDMLTSGLVENMFLWGELRGDMLAIGNVAEVSDFNIMNAEIQPTNNRANWSSIYRTINYCNTVIEFGPNVKNNDPTLTDGQLNAYLAEARAIRGLMYFYLLRIWGEVPLQLRATSSDATIQQLPKSSREEVYNQIVADLDYASINAVPAHVPGAPLDPQNKGRITQYAVNAIQADVYLWNEKYEEAIAACNKVIASNRFGLNQGANNQALWFVTTFVRGNSNESIFELQFTSQTPNNWYNVFANTSTRRFIASPKLPTTFFPDDPNQPDKIDIRGNGVSYRGADNVIMKFVGTDLNNIIGTTALSDRHWFFYRYADILLMKAEALAWTGKGDEALALINDIRTRANAPDLTKESPDVTSPSAVSDYIMNERAREFAFEGKRWFDILRNSKRNNYANLDYMLKIVAESALPDRQQSIITKYRDTRSHYLPIHISELQADKQLVQNPFYSN